MGTSRRAGTRTTFPPLLLGLLDEVFLLSGYLMVFSFLWLRGMRGGVRGCAAAGVFARTTTLRDFFFYFFRLCRYSVLPSREKQPRCGTGKSRQTPLPMPPAPAGPARGGGDRKIEKSPGVDGMGWDKPPSADGVSRDAPTSRRSQSFPYPALLSSGAGGEFCRVFAPSLAALLRDCVKHL